MDRTSRLKRQTQPRQECSEEHGDFGDWRAGGRCGGAGYTQGRGGWGSTAVDLAKELGRVCVRARARVPKALAKGDSYYIVTFVF